ncbi:hypothetical protein HPB48_011123 [Haemaphysalis longicornis]|uniref:Monocarboxylate transporter n=1 Tax=Haemaphysalis longicornis TaxID=44386 RepID=A0A9J6GTL0_HAELO|nr:hypothetical protein HPB48_011123 [Haemaphysalis longicornis]
MPRKASLKITAAVEKTQKAPQCWKIQSLLAQAEETPPQTQLRGSSYCKEDNGIDNYKRRALFGRLTFMLQRRFSLNQDLGNSHRTSHIGPLKEVQSILQTPAVYALSSTYVIFEYCHIVATTNIVAYAVDKGSPLPIAESLIMYGAVASMTGRIVLPVASDTLGLKRDLLVVGNLLAVSLCFALLPEVSSFLHVVILLVGEGVASGAVLAMKPVIVAEYLGVEKMTATWGIMGVFMVPVFLASPYIIGMYTVIARTSFL